MFKTQGLKQGPDLWSALVNNTFRTERQPKSTAGPSIHHQLAFSHWSQWLLLKLELEIWLGFGLG